MRLSLLGARQLKSDIGPMPAKKSIVMKAEDVMQLVLEAGVLAL